MKVLVTGARGFIGQNLCESLKNIRDGKDRRECWGGFAPLEVMECDHTTSRHDLAAMCARADFVVHLAGVNRPQDPAEYDAGNVGFTRDLLDLLEERENAAPVLLASSVQATLAGRYAGSAYGTSKLAAEELVRDHASWCGGEALIYRFPNVYGKWSRPNYNSAIATFCHQIARGLPFQVNDPSVELDLLYIDDLVDEVLCAIAGNPTRTKDGFCVAGPVDHVALSQIVILLESFAMARRARSVPDVTINSFSKKLYSTYLSFVDPADAAYPLTMNVDERGSFTEMLRTPDRGQVSINVSRPGVTKGQHWHHTKWEKFCVVSGEGLIRLRRAGTDENGRDFPVHEYHVTGEKLVVVEMLPGYTHSIVNLSPDRDLVTVMWCNECFDPSRPDTYGLEV